MKLRLINLIFLTVISTVCLGLLVYVGYAWYVQNKKVEATNISFNVKDKTASGYTINVISEDGDYISANILPDFVSELTIRAIDLSQGTKEFSLVASNSYKDVITDGNNIITGIRTGISDNDAIQYVTTDASKYYLLDNYFNFTLENQVFTQGEKAALTDAQKAEFFTSLYNLNSYDLRNKLYYYVSNTKIDPVDYKTSLYENHSSVHDIYKVYSAEDFDETIKYYTLDNEAYVEAVGLDADTYASTKANTTYYVHKFRPLKNALGDYEINFSVQLESENDSYAGEKYLYLYFDPTEEYFFSTEQDLDGICLYSQNPYFYQAVTFNIEIPNDNQNG